LSGEGRKDIVGTPRWENELWSYLESGDGLNCPIYESCSTRLRGVHCISGFRYIEEIGELVDNDESDLNRLTVIEPGYPGCQRDGRIFKLVRRLTSKFQAEAGIDGIPVPANLILRDYNGIPIEFRQVPLKVHHGAVWRLSDCWLVHLNSNSTRARKRFTLYHEIFHILAHCRASPVFKKASRGREGAFNELLADYFAANMLLPEGWVRKVWAEVKDVDRMAAIFDVPRPVVYLAIKGMGLV